MSQAPSNASDSESPYPRSNYHGYLNATADDDGSERVDLYERGRPGQGEEWAVHHTFAAGTDPAETIAYQWLYDDATLLCNRSLEEHGEEIELTDPTFHAPKDGPAGVEYRQHRHRRRYNPEEGYINWGETTSVYLKEVDTETFLTTVMEWLASCHDDLADDVTDEAVQRARRLKGNPEVTDLKAMREVVADVRAHKDAEKDSPFRDS